MRLSEYLINKNDLGGITMIRLIYKETSFDYSKWKISGQNVFFYDNNLKVGHVLWTTDNVNIIDDTKITINADTDPKYTVQVELFYGGAIL